MSLPSCPVAPRIATGLEDDIALYDILERGMPLHQALIPFDGARRRAVDNRPLAQRSEDLARAGLRRLAGRIAESIGNLLETDLVGSVIRFPVPIFDVRRAERVTQPLRQRTDL